VSVAESELAYRKLHHPDPIKLAEQRLKVRDEEKRMQAAQKQVELHQRNYDAARERFELTMKRETRRRDELREDVEECAHRAPNPGVVLLGRHHWLGFGLGQEVREGLEIMTLSDLRKMKAVLTVDEGRIARVRAGQRAVIRPVGSMAAFRGKVEKVAEKGQDEFADFHKATQDLVGKADRQVFEVEVTLDEEAPDLRPGLRLEAEIEIRELREALVIPRSALSEGEDGKASESHVRAATPLGPVRRRVKVLAGNGLHCAVEGLEEGEQVWLLQPSP
jgi:multidrug resistance efflux pump